MTYPGGLQVGGGITASTAGEFLDAGASHVIVTSWVFTDGQIVRERLQQLVGTLWQAHRHHHPTSIAAEMVGLREVEATSCLHPPLLN